MEKRENAAAAGASGRAAERYDAGACALCEGPPSWHTAPAHEGEATNGPADEHGYRPAGVGGLPQDAVDAATAAAAHQDWALAGLGACPEHPTDAS